MKCTLYHVRSRQLLLLFVAASASFWVSELFGGRVALLRSCVASFVLVFDYFLLFFFYLELISRAT